jgi:tetratricopeptide (TPR) repeat protein
MSDADDKKAFDARHQPDPARLKEFTETARRLQQERTGTREVTEKLLDTTPLPEWPGLAGRPELRNSGALEQLAARVRARCEHDPREALAAASLATAIAETLPPGAYPAVTLAQLRAHAWKDRAHTLRFLGRYDEALDAVAMAERALEPFPATAYDRAVVGLVKAATLQHIERFDESGELLAECAGVFRDHGDTKQQLYCTMIHAALFYRLGQYLEAEREWTDSLTVALGLGDMESVARAHGNLASCALHLGDVSTGKAHVGQAKEIFYELGRDIEAIRIDLAFARLLVKNGDITHGIILLRKARESFLSHQLVEEAGLCGLSIAEAFVGRGDYAAAFELTDEIIRDFSHAALNSRAIQAVQSLQVALAARDVSVAAIRHVGRYIEDLRRDPDLEFVALSA